MRNATRGYVFGLTLHVVLLLLVLGQLVYLSSYNRIRADLTSDRIYSLTESTTRVVQSLENPLLIEVYQSPDSELPVTLREPRQLLKNLLDEYAERSDGRLRVQYFDPQSDTDLREKATRLGIKPQRTQDNQQTTLSNKEIWQGLRLRYGADRQKTVPFLGFATQPYQYEAALTPVIKALTVVEKPEVGVIAWPSYPPITRGRVGVGEQERPQGFRRILEMEAVKDRYKIVDVDLSQGQLIPDQLDTLVLIRPRDLTDRNKYAIDQFLMRGGELVIFADTWDVSLGQGRTLTAREVAYDQLGSKVKFLEQLGSYGAEVSDRVLLDAANDAREAFVLVIQTPQGLQVPSALPFYPYWWKPLHVDWATKARDLATNNQTKEVDEALAEQYAKEFTWGVEEDVARDLGIPTVYWPCAVDLSDELPEGVEGTVMMRSSPVSMLQTPPRDMSPVAFGAADAQQAYNTFVQSIMQVLVSEPRQQYGLLVHLGGSFRSFFEGREIPKAREEEPEIIKDDEDPLEDPITADPTADPIGPLPPGQQDPAVPEGEADAERDPDPLFKAAPGSRLVVFGDTELIRDDLVSGMYQNLGGPVSLRGPTFFVNLLDWLAEDTDLFELRRKVTADRALRFGGDQPITEAISGIKLEEEKRDKERMVRMANIAVPPLVLLLFGMIVFLQRRARKRAFLARTGN